MTNLVDFNWDMSYNAYQIDGLQIYPIQEMMTSRTEKYFIIMYRDTNNNIISSDTTFYNPCMNY